MEAFATVDDLQTGWKALSADEQAVAGELLMRATAQLSALLSASGVPVDGSDEVQATNLKSVTCNMVRRSMASGGSDGVSSFSQSVGSTSASVQWSNPDGAFYLSKLDKQILGLNRARIGWIDLSQVG